MASRRREKRREKSSVVDSPDLAPAIRLAEIHAEATKEERQLRDEARQLRDYLAGGGTIGSEADAVSREQAADKLRVQADTIASLLAKHGLQNLLDTISAPESEPASPPVPSHPFLDALDALGLPRVESHHPSEVTYGGRQGRVYIRLFGKSSWTVHSIYFDDDPRDEEKNSCYASVTFAHDPLRDDPHFLMVDLIAGYIKGDHAAFLAGAARILRALYRPDPQRGLIDRRTGASPGRAGYVEALPFTDDMLDLLNWAARKANAQIQATFDADGGVRSFDMTSVGRWPGLQWRTPTFSPSSYHNPGAIDPYIAGHQDACIRAILAMFGDDPPATTV